MQLKTITIAAASFALAQAGTWSDDGLSSKTPVADSTTKPHLPTTKPHIPSTTKPVADETTSTWADVDLTSSTPVADTSSTQAYWGDETSVADESTTSTWADVDLTSSTPVADSTTSTWADVDLTSSTPVADTSSTEAYWGDETSVADSTTTSSATWADYTGVTTTEETSIESVTKTITWGNGKVDTTTEVNTITYTKTIYVTPTPATPVADVTGGYGGKPDAPAGGEGKPGCGVVTVTNTVVSTVTVPAGGAYTPPAAPPASTPAVPTETAVHTWGDVPAAPSAAAPAAPQSGYMGIVDEWRAKMGLSDLEHSDKLQSNAQNAADSSGGQLKHKLNPGSMAQVMAPGSMDDFESVFLGGWLCEMPSLPGLGSSVCDAASKGWNHAGQTGHAKILTSGNYKQIGCAVGDGIVCCDLA